MSKRATRIAIIVLAVLLLLGIGVYVVHGVNNDQPIPGVPSTSSASASTPAPIASAPTSDLPPQCDTDPQPMTNPLTMALVTQEREFPMVSVGTVQTESGTAAGAPDGNEPFTVAWYNEGPQLGSAQGKAVLTSHTYQWGEALGNQLINGLISPGDVVMFTDDADHHVCYRYTEVLHILVADYDPTSDVLYDYTGAPKFALVVCSDYTVGGETLGRMIYYGELMRG